MHPPQPRQKLPPKQPGRSRGRLPLSEAGAEHSLLPQREQRNTRRGRTVRNRRRGSVHAFLRGGSASGAAQIVQNNRENQAGCRRVGSPHRTAKTRTGCRSSPAQSACTAFATKTIRQGARLATGTCLISCPHAHQHSAEPQPARGFGAVTRSVSDMPHTSALRQVFIVHAGIHECLAHGLLCRSPLPSLPAAMAAQRPSTSARALSDSSIMLCLAPAGCRLRPRRFQPLPRGRCGAPRG